MHYREVGEAVKMHGRFRPLAAQDHKVRTELRGHLEPRWKLRAHDAESLPVRKPDPQGVCYLRRMTGIDLAATLLIGDSRIDVDTGRAAGVTTCGVTWGFGAEGMRACAPQFVVNSVPQLINLVLSPV